MRLHGLILLIFVLLGFAGCNSSGGSNPNEAFGIINPNGDGSGTASTSRLVSFSGDNQRVELSESAALPLKVMAVNSKGEPLNNIPVSFSIMSPDPTYGIVSSAVVNTGPDGVAQTTFTAGSFVGEVVIQALASVGSVTFKMTVTGYTGYSLVKHPLASGDGQSGFVLSNLASPFKVVLTDSNGDPVQGATIRFTALGSFPGSFSGSTYSEVVTDAFGIAVSPIYSLSNHSGSNVIKAQMVLDSTVAVDLTVTGNVSSAAVISASSSTIEFSQTSVVADGFNVADVILTIKDVHGNLIPNATYAGTITSNFVQLPLAPAPLLGGSWNNAWSYTSVGTYKRSFTVGNSAGTLNISSASINGVNLSSAMPTLAFVSYGTFNQAQTTLSVTTSPIVADGVSTTTVIVTLKDDYGNPVASPGQAIVLNASSGTLLGAATYHSATGTYRQVLRAPTNIGTGNITVSLASINGSAMGGITTTVQLSGAAFSLAYSTFDVSQTTYANAQNGTFTVTIKDVFNNSIPLTGAIVTLNKTVISGTNNSSSISAIMNSSPGVYQATLTAPSWYSTGPHVDSWTATITHPNINGGALTTIGSTLRTQYNSTRPVPSAANSVYSLNSTYAKADNGTSFLTGTISLLSSTNEPILVGGYTPSITVTNDLGANVSAITDNNNGSYSFRIYSTATPTRGSLTVKYNGSNLTASPVSMFFYGAPDLVSSLFTLGTSNLSGPGTSVATVRLRDSINNDIPATTLTSSDFRFVVTGNGGMNASPVKTSAGGFTEFTQTYERVATPDFAPNETVSIVAQINLTGSWTSLVTTRTITIQPPNLAGITIDCDNIDTYRNKHLYVKSGTLKFVSWRNGGIMRTSQCAAYPDPQNPFTFGSLTIDTGGIVTTLATVIPPDPVIVYGIDLQLAGNLDIKFGGKIELTGFGYPGGYAPDSVGAPSALAPNGGLGGGAYANESYPGANNAYGSQTDPALPGMGSWDGACRPAGVSCGVGGGLFRVKAQSAIIDGSIYANATIGIVPGHGAQMGGAGGAIKLDLSGTLTGSGAIEADGGGSKGTAYHIPGGGGRIAIYGDSSNFPLSNIRVDARKGVNWNGRPDGSLGTLYLSQTVTNNQRLSGRWEVGNLPNMSRIIFAPSTELTIDTNSSLIVQNPLTLKSLTLKSGAVLTHSAVTNSILPKLNLNVTDFIKLEVGSSIDVTKKGYMGGFTNSFPAAPGCGLTPTSPSNFTPACGLASSNKGANHYTLGGGNTGFTWGDPTNPVTHGAGGSGGHSVQFPCSAGGGVIILNTDDLILDGTINAGTTEGVINGICSGASGGSINITADTISSPAGVSSIKSNGQYGSYNYGATEFSGGAGGIIKITANSVSDAVESRVYAVKGLKGTSGAQDGSDGVITITINGVTIP